MNELSKIKEVRQRIGHKTFKFLRCGIIWHLVLPVAGRVAAGTAAEAEGGRAAGSLENGQKVNI